MKTFGLKDEFDFREVTIGRINPADRRHCFSLYCDILKDKVVPVIMILEEEKLINSFHFISHDGVDLRLSTLTWGFYEERIKEILIDCGIEEELHPYNDLGNDLESIVKSNFLETVSRCVLAEVCAEGESSRKNLSHYLNNQYGFWNLDEAFYYLVTGEFYSIISLIYGQMRIEVFRLLLKMHRKRMKKMLRVSKSRKLSNFIGKKKEGVDWFLNKSKIK